MNVAVEMDAVRQGELLDIREGGPAPKRIIAGFGFWIFLLSDIVMFSALFASYAVLAKASAGGLTGAQLFDQRNVAIETALLLLSSYACGMMSLPKSWLEVASFWSLASRSYRYWAWKT